MISSACAGSVISPTAPVGDARLAADALGERHLVAGPDGICCVRAHCRRRRRRSGRRRASRSSAELDSTARGPSRLRPSRSPRSGRRAAALGPDGANRVDDASSSRTRFSSEPPYSSVARVAQRREELVQQVAVRRMDLDDPKAGAERARAPRRESRRRLGDAGGVELQRHGLTVRERDRARARRAPAAVGDREPRAAAPGNVGARLAPRMRELDAGDRALGFDKADDPARARPARRPRSRCPAARCVPRARPPSPR